MSITLEGIVEDGRIKLASPVRLPERTRVYVILPDDAVTIEGPYYLRSPHFVNSEDADQARLEPDGSR